jgi:pimeloyl-ACP methyl ester carboxylesterase
MKTKLVLLPGMDGTGDLFAGFIKVLPDPVEVQVVRYPTQFFLSYKELLSLVRDACPVSEPFALLAESFSTPLAIQFAAANPPNLKRVILCAGFASSPVHGWKRIIAPFLAPIIFRIPLPEFALSRWLIGPHAPSTLRTAVKAAISSVRANVLSARLRAILECEVRCELSQVAIPILFIHATQDRLIPETCLNGIQRNQPLTEVATINGPHLILQRRPQKSAAIVSQFLDLCSMVPKTDN